MSDILIKNIRLEKPYTDIRIMPDGTYYHPFRCFGSDEWVVPTVDIYERDCR